MSFRALINLRQTPNFIYGRSLPTLGRNVSRQPRQPRLLFHSSPMAAERQMRNSPRLLPSKLRNTLSRDPESIPKTSQDPADDDGGPRSEEEQERLEELKRGANVRWFEQDVDGTRKELKSIHEWAESMDGGVGLPEEIKNDPKKLQEAMDEVARDAEEERMWQSMGPEFEEELFEEESADDIRAQLEKEFKKGIAKGKTIEQMRAKLREDVTIELQRQLVESGQAVSFYRNRRSERIFPPTVLETAFSKSYQRTFIRKMNRAVARAYRVTIKEYPMTRKVLVLAWKGYAEARQTLAVKWHVVPKALWDYLWSIFSIEDPVINPNRMAHISRLARDLSYAGVSLSPAQQLLTMEALFVETWESEAIKNWTRCTTTLGAEGSDTFTEFWELGVRMFCKLGDMDEANRAIDTLLDGGSDPRILISLVGGYLAKGTGQGVDQAWGSYKRLRKALGSNIKIEDYDQVIYRFLAANRIELGLRAFVDMMTSDSIDVEQNKRLPLVIGNKFFFGKWLKRLIGAGDVDGADKVVKFMLRRHVPPAAIQVNGLIGAWLRTGLARPVAKAEKVAWAMINERLELVRARQIPQSQRQEPDASQPLPYPPATLETFSLLAENYRLRHVRKSMDRLYSAFTRAEIKSDAFMMNQILESHLQYGDYDQALQHYRSNVTGGHVTPTSHTFMVLWKVLFVNRASIDGDQQFGEIRRARATFAEMIQYRHIFQGQMSSQLARKVLHTFRKLKDPHGLIVALQALDQIFGHLPNEILTLELTVGSTNLGLDNDSVGTRAKHKLMQHKRDMDADIWHQRTQKSLAKNDGMVLDLEELEAGGTKDERGRELLDYLIRFYMPKREAEIREFVDDARLIEDAAREMGVYGAAKAEAEPEPEPEPEPKPKTSEHVSA